MKNFSEDFCDDEILTFPEDFLEIDIFSLVEDFCDDEILSFELDFCDDEMFIFWYDFDEFICEEDLDADVENLLTDFIDFQEESVEKLKNFL